MYKGIQGSEKQGWICWLDRTDERGARPDREGRADEIDMVLIGSDGLIVVEVKHWDRAFIKSNQHLVEDELDRLERKARRLKGRLEKLVAIPGFVAAKLLLTRETKTLGGTSIRGVGLYLVTRHSCTRGD